MIKITGLKTPHKSPVTRAYRIHSGALRRFVSRILGGHQDVDDILQEAFYRAYAAEKGKPIAQPKPYLFRTAKHLALNHLKRESIRPTDYLGEEGGVESLGNSHTLEDEVMAQQRIEVHCAAVATLPAQCRKIYLMCKVYGLSYKEIAQELEITVSTVESHLEKAFSRCQRYVEMHLENEHKARSSEPAIPGKGV